MNIKEGCEMIKSASYINVFGSSVERVLEKDQSS